MFSDPEKLRLVEAMRRTGTTRLEIDCGDDSLTLALPAGGQPAIATAVQGSGPVAVKSPGMGRFVACGRDDGLIPVSTGDRISKGQVLGYLEVDGARLQITAPDGGILTDGPEEGRIAGYGDLLFTLEAGR
ncbi:acetyl-CoA carboxylase biotin carboxyl carrier protein [Marinovum sp.]|uniref:acetyl-CoA carboxylase biotin carboxyl carrier protein n=1 Tax=Marinovum sp. TaxID=2024839 RepID=UPI003A92631F